MTRQRVRERIEQVRQVRAALAAMLRREDTTTPGAGAFSVEPAFDRKPHSPRVYTQASPVEFRERA